jgi:hypothetical protein
MANNKINRNELELDNTLVMLQFLLKGFHQTIEVYTTATESLEFVDWLNNNPELNSYKVEDKEKFTNKYFIFDDYIKKSTVCINKDQIKYFEIPYFVKCDDNVKFKILYME